MSQNYWFVSVHNFCQFTIYNAKALIAFKLNIQEMNKSHLDAYEIQIFNHQVSIQILYITNNCTNESSNVYNLSREVREFRSKNFCYENIELCSHIIVKNCQSLDFDMSRAYTHNAFFQYANNTFLPLISLVFNKLQCLRLPDDINWGFWKFCWRVGIFRLSDLFRKVVVGRKLLVQC